MRQATVVSRPFCEATASSPVCMSRNPPVPYVVLTMPRSKHAWPKSAACWSPAMPAMGISTPRISLSRVPITPLESTTSGRMARGISMRSSSSPSQARVWMLKSIVREALETSVTWTCSRVRFQISQASTVPKSSSPACAATRAPGALRKIHWIFVAQK